MDAVSLVFVNGSGSAFAMAVFGVKNPGIYASFMEDLQAKIWIDTFAIKESYVYMMGSA